MHWNRYCAGGGIQYLTSDVELNFLVCGSNGLHSVLWLGDMKGICPVKSCYTSSQKFTSV